MKVPLLDLEAHHGPLHRDILNALERVLRSQHFILGPEVEALEKDIAAYVQSRFAIGVSSGTDALLVALMALDIRAGDEIVTSPYSFFATAGVIARLGARPVFVDIDPVTYNIDPRHLERALTLKTRAIIPVHLFGQCADMSPILDAARRRKIPIIEDAAQAIGAEYAQGQRAGGMAEMGCFSFFPSKNLGALGDGGMVVTSDETLAEKLRALRVHGAKRKYYHTWVGGNFRLDALQAAVLSVKLPHLNAWSARRQENAWQYGTLFQESGLVEKGTIHLPQAVYANRGLSRSHIYNQFVIRARRRDDLRTFLQKKNIGTEVYYPVPLHLQDCFKSLGHHSGDFPEAEKAALESLALPIYPELTREMQQAVVTTIKEFYTS